MTWSAPIDLAISTFLVLHTAVTSAPSSLAIWTANVPTPPEAPSMRTLWPGCIRPQSRRPWSAVIAAMGTAAASSNDRLAGFGANFSSDAHTYSANPFPSNPVIPKTSSPARNCFTSLPTASTRPAISQPMIGLLGLPRSPGMRFHGAPCSTNRSTGFTDAARSLIKTSLQAGLGVGTSANCNWSGDPYCVRTIAFIETFKAVAGLVRGRGAVRPVTLSRESAPSEVGKDADYRDRD